MFRFCKILLFISATYIGHGQINESFDALSENAYGNYIYNGFGVFNGLSNSTNALSGNCIRLRDDTSSLEYIGLDGNGKDGGVGEISFWYRSWDCVRGPAAAAFRRLVSSRILPAVAAVEWRQRRTFARACMMRRVFNHLLQVS